MDDDPFAFPFSSTPFVWSGKEKEKEEEEGREEKSRWDLSLERDSFRGALLP